MDEIKYIIKAMVTSYAGRALTVSQLNKDYKEHEGQYIPYRMYGFRRLEKMLLQMPDAVQLRGSGDNALVLPVDSGKSQHIRSMIAQQKSSGRKPPNNSARNRSKGYRSPYNNNATYNNSCTRPRTAYIPAIDDSYTSPDEITRDQLLETSPIDPKKCSDNEYSNGQDVESVIPDSEEEEPSAPIPCATPMTLADKLSEPEVPSTLIPETIQRVKVVKVHSPNEILVQLICHLEMLVQVADSLEVMYGTLDSDSEWELDVESAKVGLCCIAKYETCWYRGTVVGPVIKGFVEVFLIDYGHKFRAPLRDVKRMRKQDSLLPPQYVRVSLANVKPVGEKWTDEAIRYLENALYEKQLYMFYKDCSDKNVLNVALIDATVLSDNIINKEIVFKKHARWECAY